MTEQAKAKARAAFLARAEQQVDESIRQFAADVEQAFQRHFHASEDLEAGVVAATIAHIPPDLRDALIDREMQRLVTFIGDLFVDSLFGFEDTLCPRNRG